MIAVARFTLPLTVLALCLFLRFAFTRASMSSKVSSSFSAETMLPLRLRFLLGVPELEALIETVAGLLSEPVSGLLVGPVGGLLAELESDRGSMTSSSDLTMHSYRGSLES